VLEVSVCQGGRKVIEPLYLLLKLINIFLDSVVFPVDYGEHKLGMLLLEHHANMHEHELDEALVHLTIVADWL
jgi:hypothetical protein